MEEKEEIKTDDFFLVDVEHVARFEKCDVCGNRIKNVAIVAREKEKGKKYKVGFDCLNQIDISTVDKMIARSMLKRLKKFINFLEECKLIVLDGYDCFLYKRSDCEILDQFLHRVDRKDYDKKCPFTVLMQVVKDLNTKPCDIDPDWRSVEFLREVMKSLNRAKIIDFGRLDRERTERKMQMRKVFG